MHEHLYEVEDSMQMAHKHRKRCSISLAIREMQIKTTRYHYTPIRMDKIKKNCDIRKCWQGCRDFGPFMHCWRYVKWYSHYRNAV